MSTDVKSLLTTGAALTDAALERLLPAATTEPHSIHRAMRHSTFAGGKRLRPILCMEAARMVAGTLPAGAAELGAAIEMVHTYSLIHDDLPALDNDDLRRGQPTCHVVFGEAIAILAGDALQTLAFQTISQLPASASILIEILREFSFAIGTGVGRDLPGSLPPGMIGGQVMDIEGEGHTPTADLVERIHRAKTGALITTSIVCGGLLGLGHCLTAGTPLACTREDAIARLRAFGESAGLAFQVISNLPAPPATVVAILHDFALAIGTGVGSPTGIPSGMIGGQVVDIESEGLAPTPELVERIHRAKTGALITTSIVCGGLLGLATKSGAPSVRELADGWDANAPSHTDTLARLRTFGESAGLAFQIVDDILDMTQTSAELGKTAGKDTAAIKATWPAVYGIEQSKKDAASLIADAFAALAPFGEAATPLKSLAQYLVDRTH